MYASKSGNSPVYSRSNTYILVPHDATRILIVYLSAGWTKAGLGGGICLGRYAEAIEYIRYMQRTVPKHPRQRRRMAYEGTSYRDDDDDDDEDDEMMLTQGHPPWDSNLLDPPQKKD